MSKISIGENSGTINVNSNNKNIKISIAIGMTAILVCIVAIFSFNSKNGVEKEIIATWQSREEADIFITFGRKNELTMKDGLTYIDGTYTITNDKIVLDLPFSNKNYGFSGTFTIEHNVLKISNVIALDSTINMMSDSFTFDLVTQ